MEPGKELATVPATVRGGIMLPRIEITDVPGAMILAGHLAKSGVLGKAMTPEVAFAIMMVGSELGITPMTALRSIYLVEGRPYMASSLLQALVLRSGQAEYFDVKESTAATCTVITMRKGSNVERSSTWDLDRARKAGLTNKSNWQTYPTQMLRHRAIGELSNDVYPDVCFNIGTVDELDGVVPVGGQVIDVDVHEVAPATEIGAQQPPVAPKATKKAAAPVPVGTTMPHGSTVKTTGGPTAAPAAAPAPTPKPATPPPVAATAPAAPAATPTTADPNAKLGAGQLRVFWHRAKKAANAAGVPEVAHETCVHEVIMRRFGIKSVGELTVKQAQDLIDCQGWFDKLLLEMQTIKAGWDQAAAAEPPPPPADDEGF